MCTATGQTPRLTVNGTHVENPPERLALPSLRCVLGNECLGVGRRLPCKRPLYDKRPFSERQDGLAPPESNREAVSQEISQKWQTQNLRMYLKPF